MTVHVEKRIKTLLLYAELKSYRDVERLSGIPKSNVHRWYSRAVQLHAQIQARRRKRTKATPKTTEIVRKLVHENPFITRSEIAAALQMKHGIRISSSTVRTIMTRDLRYSRKRSRRIVVKNASHLKALVREREMFRSVVAKVPSKDIISIEVMGLRC